jgi:hypothetical protein
MQAASIVQAAVGSHKQLVDSLYKAGNKKLSD